MKKIVFIACLFSAIGAFAQTGIGTTTPDASARLDVSATNKGFLPPRVALTATNAAGPISSPATGLLVYNTATAGTSPNNVTPGYYFWNGTAWLTFAGNSVSSVGAISGTSTANGASITSGVLNLAPADATNGGVVNTGTQTFAGSKTFSSDLTVNSQTVGSGNFAVMSNSAFGYNALSSAISGSSNNTGIGFQTLYSTTTGSSNVAIGSRSLYSLVSGINNTGVGYYALSANTASGNSAFGSQSLNSNTTGLNNTGLGFSALKANTIAGDNTAVGYNTLTANTTGVSNTAIGSKSMISNTTGSNNVAMGLEALTMNTTGSHNVAIGQNSLKLNTGSFNSALGTSALGNLTSGVNNTAVGYGALSGVVTTGNNTALGYKAGQFFAGGSSGSYFNALGSNSIFIGANTGPAADNETNEIVIGYNAVGLGSNTILIGNSSNTATTINGDLSLPSTTASTSTTTGALKVSGGVGIAGALNIGGNEIVTGSLSGANTATSTISGFAAALPTAQSGTTYTLAATDNGKILQFTSASAVTLTLPSTGLPAGFNCMVIQMGAGQVTFTGGATIYNRNTFTKTAGQYSIVTVLYLSASTAITSGEMSN